MKFDFKWQPLAANLYGWLVCERADGRLRLFTCGTSKEISRAEFGLLLDLIETAWAFLCNDSAACGMLCFMTDTCFVWRCPTCGDTTIAMNRWSARLNDDGLKARLSRHITGYKRCGGFFFRDV